MSTTTTFSEDGAKHTKITITRETVIYVVGIPLGLYLIWAVWIQYALGKAMIVRPNENVRKIKRRPGAPTGVLH